MRSTLAAACYRCSVAFARLGKRLAPDPLDRALNDIAKRTADGAAIKAECEAELRDAGASLPSRKIAADIAAVQKPTPITHRRAARGVK